MAMTVGEANAVNAVIHHLVGDHALTGQPFTREEAIDALVLLVKGAYKTVLVGYTPEESGRFSAREALAARWPGALLDVWMVEMHGAEPEPFATEQLARHHVLTEGRWDPGSDLSWRTGKTDETGRSAKILYCDGHHTLCCIWPARVHFGPLDGTAPVDARDEQARACKTCGCTEDEPCEGGCSWVTEGSLEIDLCTACAWAIAHDAIASGLYQSRGPDHAPREAFTVKPYLRDLARRWTRLSGSTQLAPHILALEYDGHPMQEGGATATVQIAHPDECVSLPPGADCWFSADEHLECWPDTSGVYRVHPVYAEPHVETGIGEVQWCCLRYDEASGVWSRHQEPGLPVAPSCCEHGEAEEALGDTANLEGIIATLNPKELALLTLIALSGTAVVPSDFFDAVNLRPADLDENHPGHEQWGERQVGLYDALVGLWQKQLIRVVVNGGGSHELHHATDAGRAVLSTLARDGRLPRRLFRSLWPQTEQQSDQAREADVAGTTQHELDEVAEREQTSAIAAANDALTKLMDHVTIPTHMVIDDTHVIAEELDQRHHAKAVDDATSQQAHSTEVISPTQRELDETAVRATAFLEAWDERYTARDQVLVQVKPGSPDMLTSNDLRTLVAGCVRLTGEVEQLQVELGYALAPDEDDEPLTLRDVDPNAVYATEDDDYDDERAEGYGFLAETEDQDYDDQGPF